MKTRAELLASDAPHACEVDVETCDKMVYIPGYSGNEIKTLCFVGSEKRAKKNAMLKPHARAVVAVRPLTYAQWLAAYGEGRM